MTIDHDAIAEKVRNFLTTGQIFGIREVMSAYLDLYDEVKRLRADMDQGAIDYCDLMTRHDAHFVAWQSAKSRAEKAEAERDRVAAEWAETSQRNYQRAKAAEAERDALRAAQEEIADGLKGIARDIQIGPDDEGREIYDMVQAMQWDARQALKGQTNE